MLFNFLALSSSTASPSHKNDLIIFCGIHDEVVVLQGLEDLNELLLVSDKWFVSSLAHAFTLIKTNVPLVDGINTGLILGVLDGVAHLEDESLLLIIAEDRLSLEQLAYLFAMVDTGSLRSYWLIVYLLIC